MTEELDFFKTSRTTDPVTQHYIPEDLTLRNNAVKTENPHIISLKKSQNHNTNLYYIRMYNLYT